MYNVITSFFYRILLPPPLSPSLSPLHAVALALLCLRHLLLRQALLDVAARAVDLPIDYGNFEPTVTQELSYTHRVALHKHALIDGVVVGEVDEGEAARLARRLVRHNVDLLDRAEL